MAVLFSKISNRSLRDQIAEKIREAVLNNSLKAGDRLVERKLAAQFGASLTAVREALITLEVDGFVVKKRNSSTYVTDFSQHELKKAFEFRRVLEGYALELAIRLATDEEIKSLELAYLDMVNAAAKGDLDLFLQKDYNWHEAVWALADNEFLVAALRRLVLPLFAFSAIRTHSGSPLDLLVDAHRHQTMLDGIKSRDIEGCRRALDHVVDEWLIVLREWDKSRTEV
ncbi:MAG TPA: GntR family transcriptional regulator [Bryobacteraceae bacterium]